MNEKTLAARPVMELRREVCTGLSGRVLELGYGSGLNADAYPPAVTAIDAVEPSDVAWGLSEARRARIPVPVRRVGLDGQRLDARDATYDAVLSTFTLCTIPDVRAALAEVHRVLRPGGAMHVLEHGSSPDARVATWQRRMEPLQKRMAGGCHLTRDVPALLTEVGLVVERLEQDYLPGPAISKPWAYCYVVTARKR
ncbi:MAG TPA: class I SAM-dependent methyltransferase [Nocardioides sp.]|nr:class I SAM-dependent methyltransferase [Nocardioides sp.]